MSDVRVKALVTFFLWVLMIGAIVPLTIVLQGTLGDDVILFPILFTIAGIVLSGFVWNWGQLPQTTAQQESEKAKRDRLAHALRDLSDNELARLRQRLASGEIDDDQLARLIDESDASKAKRY